MRFFIQTIAAFLGIVFLVSPLAVWFLAWASCMAGANGELQLISQNDRTGAYAHLTFGPWREGVGDCSPSSYAPLPEGARITRHRIGHAYGFLSQINYYEAEYVLPDGSTEINHAEGPLPLFTKRWSVIIAISIAGPLLAAGMLMMVAKSNPDSGKAAVRASLVEGLQQK